MKTADPQHQPTRITTSQDNPIHVILHGPHAIAGGGVLAFCNTLEHAIQHGGEPVTLERWFIGAAKGDDLNTGGAIAGIKAMLGSLPQLWRLARPGRVVHFNTSFTKKALLRDAMYHRLARLRGARVIVQFHGGSPSVNRDRLSQSAIRTLCQAPW